MTSSEEFLEHPVKLLPNLLKFFLKLTAHSEIKLLNDLYKRFLRLHKILVLSLHKQIAL